MPKKHKSGSKSVTRKTRRVGDVNDIAAAPGFVREQAACTAPLKPTLWTDRTGSPPTLWAAVRVLLCVMYQALQSLLSFPRYLAGRSGPCSALQSGLVHKKAGEHVYKVALPFTGDHKRLAITRNTLHEAHSSILLIDANNVRGATNFRWSLLELAARVTCWARENGFGGRVVLAVDRGPRRVAFLHEGLCVAFSGPSRLADDAIAASVPWLHRRLLRDVVVVTRDVELIQRCTAKRGAGGMLGLGGGKTASAEVAREPGAVERACQVAVIESDCFCWLLGSAAGYRSARILQEESEERAGEARRKHDRQGASWRRETTLMRSHMADALCQLLQKRSGSAAPSRGSVDAQDHRGNALLRYIDAVNCQDL